MKGHIYVCIRIKRYHVFGLELRPGNQVTWNSLQNETRSKSLAPIFAEWAFEVVLGIEKVDFEKNEFKVKK